MPMWKKLSQFLFCRNVTRVAVRKEARTMIVLRNDQLPVLVEQLQNDFPRSLMVFHLARNVVRGRYAWPGTEFVVDDFPNVSVCIFRPKANDKSYVPIMNGYEIFVYSKDVNIFRRMVFEETALDWTNEMLFAGMLEPEHRELLELGNRTCIGRFAHYSTMDGFPPGATYLLFDLDHLDYSYTLPGGFRLGPLTPAHAKQIAEEKDYGHLENNIAYIRYMLEQNYPSLAIFDDSDKPIAYVMYKSEGCIGAAYVNPDHRGKKLFQIVVHKFLKILKKRGEIFVYGDTMLYNLASISGQQAVGGKRYDDFVAHWITYTPSPVQNSRIEPISWTNVDVNGTLP